MKKLLKIVLSLLLVILIAAAGYIVYVLTAYYRVEDNITLSVQGAGDSSLTSETTYRIVTYNVGFGAYSADYSFFMDGGIYSRAYSAEAAAENMTPEGFSIIKPLGDTPTPSCRLADSPYTKDSFVLTVDGFIVSDNIFVADSAVYDAGFTYSDHNPVYLDFVLK